MGTTVNKTVDKKELVIASILSILYHSSEDDESLYDTPVSDRMLFDFTAKLASENKVREILQEMVKRNWIEEIDFGAGTGRLFYRIKRLGEELYEERETIAY